jgi:hypothetical protein
MLAALTLVWVKISEMTRMTPPPRMPEWDYWMSRLTSLAQYSVTVYYLMNVIKCSALQGQRDLTYSEHDHQQ